MSIEKQATAQKVWGEMEKAGDNLDHEWVVSQAISLTGDPRLHPGNEKLAYQDLSQRFGLARQLIFDIAFPRTTEALGAKKRKVVIELKPTEDKSEAWEEADEKTKEFRENVEKAGFVDLKKGDLEYLDNQGLLPEKMQGSEITSALHLYARGASSDEIMRKAEAAQAGVLNGAEKDYLVRTAYFIATFEEANLKEGLPSSEMLQLANLKPEASISSTSDPVKASDNQFVFASDGRNMFPVIQTSSEPNEAVLGLRNVLSDTVFNAVEKGGKKLVKKGLKNLEKAGIKKLEKTAAKEIVGVAAKAGVKAAVKGTIMAAAEAAGTTVPIIGNIIAWLVVEIGDKLLSLAAKVAGKVKKWLEENKEVVAGFGLLAIIAGLLMGIVPLTVLGLGSVLLVGAPVGGVVLGVAGGVISFVGQVFLSVLEGVGTAFVLFVTALMIVIVTFYIITVGGYVVPYWGNDAYPGRNINQTNPYIGVGKVADPSEANNPTSVTYTITINAKRDNLTNLHISSYTCTVEKKDGSSVDCPPDQPPAISPDVVVGASTAYTFTYTIDYGKYGTKYANALIVDTITITADTPTQTGVSSSSSAGVCFGDCPEDCPRGWPVGPEGGESRLQVTQGPFAHDPGTHRVLEGVDITNYDSPSYSSFNGHTIKATHSGLFCAPQSEPDRYGNVVYIVGQCNGRKFVSLYAHIMQGSAMLPSGTKVTKGQSIALTDDTGGWDFPHLHYEFANAAGDGSSCSGFNAYVSPGAEPSMTTVYGVPRGCYWNCGVTIP